jgi:hypothetical protein
MNRPAVADDLPQVKPFGSKPRQVAYRAGMELVQIRVVIVFPLGTPYNRRQALVPEFGNVIGQRDGPFININGTWGP